MKENNTERFLQDLFYNKVEYTNIYTSDYILNIFSNQHAEMSWYVVTNLKSLITIFSCDFEIQL